jgi:hypothetical protein
MRRPIATLVMVIVLLFPAISTAQGVWYLGVSPDDSTAGVILRDGQRVTVRVGDVLPGLGTVHALAAHELIVRRILTTAEQFDLLDRGKAVIDVVEMRFRSLAPMLVPGPTRP